MENIFVLNLTSIVQHVYILPTMFCVHTFVYPNTLCNRCDNLKEKILLETAAVVSLMRIGYN